MMKKKKKKKKLFSSQESKRVLKKHSKLPPSMKTTHLDSSGDGESTPFDDSSDDNDDDDDEPKRVSQKPKPLRILDDQEKRSSIETNKIVLKLSTTTYTAKGRKESTSEDCTYSVKRTMKRTRLSADQTDDCFEKEPALKKRKRKFFAPRPGKDCNGPNPPPPLPEAFKKRIRELVGEGANVSEEKLVIQKTLFGTDLSGSHNRLSMPTKQILNKFLDEDEDRLLSEHDGTHWRAIMVPLIDPQLKLWEEVAMKKWR